MERTRLILKDSTLREGLDVPGVILNASQKKEIISKLHEVGLPEVELVSPGRFANDLEDLRQIGPAAAAMKFSGLVYSSNPAWRDQIREAKTLLNRLDILVPLPDSRPPLGREEKLRCMLEVLDMAGEAIAEVGVGFPHATQVEPRFVLSMCRAATQAGAKRITLYDTNGSADPWLVASLVEQVRKEIGAEICFHAHNDLGMATANSLAAVRAGADCLDVTVNGLGDRAGNASLEQVVMALHARGVSLGLRLDLLGDLSKTVAALTRIPVSKLAPVVGQFAFRHKSPGHLNVPELFEPFDPGLVGTGRTLCDE